MDVFRTLLDIDDALVDWVLHASPTTDEQRAAMKQVLALRGDLEDALNELVACRLQLATAQLPAEANQLDSLSTQMNDVQKQIESVEQVLGIAGQAASVAAKILAVVA